ncbi:MAG: DUF91 domain-containing protein [Clostridia bacterium]|nr:DUF91 domain-containing protein [Clostridia bacterium]
MAQVFIVDEQTLSVHLKYMFAGTGAKDYSCEYLFKKNINVHPTVERLLTGMIADISRIKKEDKILFYLQQTRNHEGMFFGSFKVEEEPFLCADEYLKSDLGKNLTFRVKILPDEVYQKGITEREALDSLKNIKHPSEMCWSLIYRKLKGNRGCTMITDYEYNSLMNKIRQKNDNKKINYLNFDYDEKQNIIIESKENFEYKGNKNSLEIKDRLIYKREKGSAYESHLQAYILQNIFDIPQLRVSNSPITWIGNEVSCGVGMQSIDICFIQECKESVDIIICELKDEQPIDYIQYQLKKYVDWIIDYLVPTYSKRVTIHPTIVAPKPNEHSKELLKSIKETTKFSSDKLEVREIRYVSFDFDNEQILFKEE